jgi:four helix bundle protein
MNFVEWLKMVPPTLTDDSVWKMEAYGLSLFAADVAWHDVTKLWQDRRALDLAGQLYDAIGSIGANLSEGYSCSSSKDRARFYEYALGSARESRTWYWEGRHVLGDSIANHRLLFLAQIIRLLLTMIPEQRQHSLREESPPYRTASETGNSMDSPDSQFTAELADLLASVPLP